jgi:hypothetical protein
MAEDVSPTSSDFAKRCCILERGMVLRGVVGVLVVFQDVSLKKRGLSRCMSSLSRSVVQSCEGVQQVS